MQTHSSCWVVAQTVMCNYVCVGQLLGCGSVAQTVLSRNSLGEPLTVHIGFSIGLMMGVYVAGGVSGKHVYCIVRTTFTLYNNHRCVCVCVCVLFCWIYQKSSKMNLYQSALVSCFL